ncbi:unnamed protein product [Paramecium octaurelia]|uniref:Kinesin-like protein n=1 Tax=Paramecium octaurelia TaxID=43137 RepID=A0A8S1USS7_PAROT|nr:unnamed protein product [Paramecium octaurelia]
MDTPKITVVIRKRPLGKKELIRGDQDIVSVQDQQTVILSEIKQKVDLTKYIEQHHFNFDLAFDETIDNQGVYHSAVRPIIQAAFNKAKCTCFAYGQTGSGKTYTMLGDPDQGVPGLYVMASYDIFAMVQKVEYQHLVISISFYEIYCGKLFDLLNDRSQLAAQEDAKGNVQIKGLSEKKINNVQQLMQIIQYGQSSRITSSNSANSESSRSHAILQITLRNNKQIHGKLSFIDLAGSERGADVRDQDKTTRVDGAEINKSLLALKECIRALDLNKNHTPFRGSKLTLVLKDSLVGNCRTVMIGNISPSSANSEHTLNTLRYADRVKELKKPQDQKNIDNPNRELFLARGDNNVIRREYKNPDSDDEEDCSTNFGQQGSQGVYKVNNSKNVLLPPVIQVSRTQSAHNKLSLNETPSNKYQNPLNKLSNVRQSNNTLQQLPPKPQPLPQHLSSINKAPLFPSYHNHIPDSLFPTDKTQSLSSQNLNQPYPPTYNFFQNPIPPTEINNGYIGDDDFQDNLLLEDADPEAEQKNKELTNQFLELDSRVLQEEDEIIISHRNHIDDMVETCKSDMCLLNSLDQKFVNSKDYFQQLKENLMIKQNKIEEFINKLNIYDQLFEQRSQIECELQNAQKYNQRNENFNQLIQ